MKTGELIVQARKKAGMTQETFRKHLKMRRQAMADIELGRRVPQRELLKEMSELVGVPVYQLLGEEFRVVAENPEAEEKYWNQVCKGCIYRKRLAGTMGARYCDFLCETGHRKIMDGDTCLSKVVSSRRPKRWK